MWIVRSATERELIEMIGSPFISFKNRRDPKKSEKRVMLAILLLCTLGTYFFWNFLEYIQYLILSSEDQIFISTAIFFIPSVFVMGCVSLLLYCYVSKQSISPDNTWKSQPAVFEAHLRFKRLKKRFIYWSLGIQILFTFNMLSYGVLDDKGLVYSPYYSLQTTNYSYDNIKKAAIYVESTRYYSKGKSHKKYPPHFEIYFNNGHCLELWNNIHYSKKDYDRLKNVVQILKEKNVPIEQPAYSLYDDMKYKKYYKKSIYEEIDDFLNYTSNVRAGTAKIFPIGESITVDSVTYQVDSSVIDYGKGFTKARNGKHYEVVYLTIENNKVDTFIFATLLNLKLIDAQQNEYLSSSWFDNTFETSIPPKTTHHGSLAFSVPDSAQQLKMCYKEGIFNPLFLWFDLSTNDPKRE